MRWVKMSKGTPRSGMDPYKFIQDNIDTVPHLEALILFWNSRPVGWSCDDLASRLYIPAEQVAQVIRDLVRIQVVHALAGSTEKFAYHPRSPEQDEMMHAVDDAYRHDLVRISTMIHTKASSAVREFARAFRLRKERDQ